MSATRVRRWVAAAVVVGVMVTSACGAGTELDSDRARELQSLVAGITQASADGRYDAALALVGTARREAEVGADAGDLSASRYREIDDALDLVESELAAAQAAAEQAAAAQAAAAEQAAAEQAAAEAAAAAAEGSGTSEGGAGKPGDPGNGGNGQGKGKGNGD